MSYHRILSGVIVGIVAIAQVVVLQAIASFTENLVHSLEKQEIQNHDN